MPDEIKKEDDTEVVDEGENLDNIDTNIFEEALNEFKQENKSEKTGTEGGETVLQSDGGSGKIVETESEKETVEDDTEDSKAEETKPDDELTKARQQTAELQAKLQQNSKVMADIEAAMKKSGFDYKGDLAAGIEAFMAGGNIDEIIERRNKEKSAALSELQKSPEYQEFQQFKRQKDLDRIYSADLEAVKKFDSTVTANNIKDIPNFDKFAQYRAKGYTAEDAYKLINFDSLTEKKANARAENIASKDHLKPVGGHGSSGGEDGVEVPAADFRQWKEWFPDDTTAQIRARYNRAMKLQKQSAAD